MDWRVRRLEASGALATGNQPGGQVGDGDGVTVAEAGTRADLPAPAVWAEMRPEERMATRARRDTAQMRSEPCGVRRRLWRARTIPFPFAAGARRKRG